MSLAVAEPLSLLPIEKKVACRPLPDGPGWFDSSRELRSGLQVDEGWPADTAVHAWVEAWLQRVAGVGAGAGLSLSAR
jgi:hypothetical protein